MQITAKFASFCGACKGAIAAGDIIEWSPGTKPLHLKCPVAVAVKVEGAPVVRTKSKFVLAMERIAAPPVSIPLPTQARPSARDHFVQLVCKHGTRPFTLELPTEGCEELVLTVGPKAQVMERALVRSGVDVFYLRYNGGALVDLVVNNVKATQEIGWRMAWSPVLQMAVEGVRIRSDR